MDRPPHKVVADISQQAHEYRAQSREAPTRYASRDRIDEFRSDKIECIARHSHEPELVEVDPTVLIGQGHNGPHRAEQSDGYSQENRPQQASFTAANLLGQLQRIGKTGHEEDAYIGAPHIGEGQPGQTGGTQRAGAHSRNHKIGRGQGRANHGNSAFRYRSGDGDKDRCHSE